MTIAMKTRRVLLFVGLGAAFAIGGIPRVIAQPKPPTDTSSFPNKPVRIIVTFAAGSATDIMTRHLVPRMSQVLGQSVAVEIRVGAAGVLGSEAIMRLPPDGYTIAMSAVSAHAIAHAVRPHNMPYDTIRDFTLIGRACTSTNVVVVHPSIPVRTLPELIEYSKKVPGGVRFASGGIGGSNHLAGEMMTLRTGAKFTHVPYSNAHRMKLCTFVIATPLGDMRRVGVQHTRGIVDATAARIAFLERTLPAAAAERIGRAQVPPDMIELIATGAPAMDWVAEAVENANSGGQSATSHDQRIVYAEGEVRLIAPVPRPSAVANFSVWPSHSATAAAKGFNLKAAEEGSGILPYWKGNPDSYVGPGAVLDPPPYAGELDVECELVCIVGTGGRDLDIDAAARAIAGYTIVNDVSARDIQKTEMKSGRGPSKGKDFDGGNVMGPWLVTVDEIGEPRSLHLSLHVNGAQWSESYATGMIWSFPEMLAYLSRGQTVLPGQVISAGCYAGGSAMDLDRHLVPGDLVELRISKIGSLDARRKWRR